MTWTFASYGNDAPMPFCTARQRSSRPGPAQAALERPVAHCGKRSFSADLRRTELCFLLLQNQVESSVLFLMVAGPPAEGSWALLVAGRGSSELSGALFRSSIQSINFLVVVVVVVVPRRHRSWRSWRSERQRFGRLRRQLSNQLRRHRRSGDQKAPEMNTPKHTSSAAIGGAATPSDFETECATVVASGFEGGRQVGPGRFELDLEST